MRTSGVGVAMSSLSKGDLTGLLVHRKYFGEKY